MQSSQSKVQEVADLLRIAEVKEGMNKAEERRFALNGEMHAYTRPSATPKARVKRLH